MSGKKIWTPEEDDVVRALFPDYRAMGQALPHRSYSGFRYRAKVMNLVKQRPPFTARELSTIRRTYPTGEKDDILALLPGRNWHAIQTVAARNGIRRERKPFKITGLTVLDQIRLRCRELHYTMPDLDKLARTKRYFEKAAWLNYTSHRALGRAVDALFGDLRADWK